MPPSILLTLVTSLTACLLLHDVTGQVFKFQTPISFHSACDLNADLAVDGTLTLTYDDLDSDHFSPLVYIKTPTSDLCTIDVTNCAATGQDACGCTQKSETEFHLFVRKSGLSSSQSGVMLHAELHHQSPSNPTIVSANIGVIGPVVVVAGGGSAGGTASRQLMKLSDGTQLMCDTTTAGGPWVVFQRRVSGAVDFFQDWAKYTEGFGDLDVGGSFWWGLRHVYAVCQKSCQLRIDMTFDGKDYYAIYQNFRLGSEADNFRLHVSGYTGTAGDVLTTRGNNIQFSTKDRDNDIYGPENCALNYHGGWWYDFCHAANLNGHWGDTRYGQGVDWHPLTSYNKSATFTEMKVRVNPVVNGNTIIGK